MNRCGWFFLGVLLLSGCGGGDGGNGPPTITSVVVSGDSTVILAGTRQLTATAMAGSTPVSTGVTFQWFSSDTTRATVSPSGLVSGVRLGSTSVTALAVLNGTPTSVSSLAHAMRTRIGSIVITPGTPTFASLGDSVLASAEARNALNAAVPGVTFTWLSRTPGVAEVTVRANNALADAVAIANGTARIVVRGDGVSDSVTATVQQIAASLALTPDTVTFGRIDSVLTPNITATDARGNAIPASALNWQSLNTAAATVNPATGAITSKNEGQSRVIATSGSLADTIRVGVALVYKSVDIATTGGLPAPIDSGVINRLNGTLQLGLIVRDSGNTVVPSPQGVTWSLKNDGTIATIGSSTGLITGNANIGRDTVVVVARTVRDSVPLIVKQVLATIAVTPASPAALNFVGDTQTFAAEPRDSGGAAIPGQTIAWSTNNAALGINAAGVATAIARTSATGITVKVRAATGGLTDSSTSIVVRQVPVSADLDPSSFGTLTAFGQSAQASCVVLDSASDTIPNHLCTWSALTAGVVTFNPTTAKTTTVTAVGNGTTTIRAQAATSLFGFKSVTVDQVAATVTISPANFGPTPDVQMITSQSAPFYAVVRDANDNIDSRARTDVVWAVSPPGAATVAATGTGTTTVTTGAGTGTATVTATIGAIGASRVVNIVGTGISYSGSIKTLLNNTCASVGCHGGSSPMQGLNLTSASSYSNLFDVAATEVPALKRVRAFRPDSSYLVHKIQGTQATVGGSGVRMPEGCTTNNSCLSNATINLIRDWILQGAPNN
jgi:hypothetical protein